jgi:Zn-dependent M28 family amino/carboxypeptidase
VLITGHYDHLGIRGTGEGDHIFNGANDDASGTASVIEIAHTLASFPSRPKRSIVFVALFGEELGLLGSRYYAQHPVFPLARTVADINLEQLGRTDVDNGIRVGLVNVTGYDYTTLPGELKKAGEEFDIQVLKDEKNSDPFFARSDNQAFADAGVPAHTLSVGYVFPDYHQAGDEWPKIDYENMARVDRTVALAIFRVADSTAAPEWNAANPKTERYVKAHESLVGPVAAK